MIHINEFCSRSVCTTHHAYLTVLWFDFDTAVAVYIPMNCTNSCFKIPPTSCWLLLLLLRSLVLYATLWHLNFNTNECEFINKMKCHALSILSYGSISAMAVYVVESIYLYAAYAFSHICIVRMYACLLKFNDNIIPSPQ